MLTDTQLTELSKKMNFKLVGCFFKDELPRKLIYNEGYIINLDNAFDEEGNPNEGSHWTALQVNKYPNGKIEPIFFDPYGAPPSEEIVKFVKNNTGKYLPYTKTDVQSLMANSCGYYCAAFLHYIQTWEFRCKDLYNDVAMFMSYFDDLNVSVDWKKNEYILAHFFMDKDPTKRKIIDIINKIQADDEYEKNNPDIVRLPTNINIMK